MIKEKQSRMKGVGIKYQEYILHFKTNNSWRKINIKVKRFFYPSWKTSTLFDLESSRNVQEINKHQFVIGIIFLFQDWCKPP
jgi:hypothetical protein